VSDPLGALTARAPGEESLLACRLERAVARRGLPDAGLCELLGWTQAELTVIRLC
jgi:hypothetical protein